MTQSDKDFITRIQVSQLVTQDPYADDFYAQVYGAILRSRAGQTQDERVLKFGSGLGVGLGVAQKASTRRPTNAMQRMEQQVERIVSNARRREEEKGLHCKCPVIPALHTDFFQPYTVFKVHLGKPRAVATRLPPASFYRSKPMQTSTLQLLHPHSLTVVLIHCISMKILTGAQLPKLPD